MLKVMGGIVRRPDLSLDAFRLHWRTIHRGLALRLAHVGLLRGYVQNHRLDIEVDGLHPIADGVPELWFEDAAAFAALRRSPALLEGAYQDEPHFMDLARYRSLLLAPESPALAPSRLACAGMLKAMLFLRDGDEAVLGHGGAVRLTTHDRSPAKAEVATMDYARVETSWWRSLDAFRAAWEARSGQGPIDGMIVEERPVFWPGQTPPEADWNPVPQVRPLP